MTTDSESTVVVLTALDTEYKAVHTFLQEPKQHRHHAGTLFEIGGLAGQAGKVVLAGIGAGNQTAAALTERAITEFRPRAVLVVGIGRALHDDLELGAVVVATKVYGYHGGSDGNSGFRPRPASWDTDHGLEQLARHVNRNSAWKRLLRTVHELPAVHFRPIAAGEVVLNSRETPLAERLWRNYSDAAAIEMESAGVAKAAHLNRVPFLTIRGISDKANGDKHGVDEAGWQSIAAANAAAFAIATARSILASGEMKAMPALPTQPSKGWWKRRWRRTVVAMGVIIAVVVTSTIVRYGDIDFSRWFRQPAGEHPVYVTATQRPPTVGEEPVVRLLPGGLTDKDRQLMGGFEWLNSPQELGIPVGLDNVQIIVQAKESRLLLTGLRLVVDERHAPLVATLLFHGTQGGPGEPIQVRFDADAPEAATPRGTAARNLQGRDYFDGANYELDPGQSVEFRAAVSTRQCYCRWHLEVDVSFNGKIQPIQVRRGDGSLFEISAATANVEQVYIYPHPSDALRPTGHSIGGWVTVPSDEFCATRSVCDPSRWPSL